MLGNHHEPLVEQVLEAVMIGLDDEPATLKVRPPVPNRLNKADELTLIGSKGVVAGRHGPAVERKRMALLN
jgi:hypothetical protein